MAYPTDPWFDPNRPSWLPYWIDDSTESVNKISYLTNNPTDVLNVMGVTDPISNTALYPNPPVVVGASAINIPTTVQGLVSGDSLSNADIPVNSNIGSATGFFNSIPTTQTLNWPLIILASLGIFILVKKV